MKKATICDVAACAGVSISTVSRVINGHSNVAPEYVQQVQRAMKELSFRPNATAQSLRRSKSQTIGLILPNMTDPFFGSIADSVITNATLAGQNVIAQVSKVEGGYDEVAQFKRLWEAAIDGLIFCSIAAVDQKVFSKYFSNLPVVICSRRELLPNCPHVYFNHQKGGYLATKHLLEMGHRKIALFVGVFGSKFHSARDLEPFLENPLLAGPYSGLDKYIGARLALEEMGIPFQPELLEFIDLGNPYESGLLAMQRLISKTTDFDALFCSNDLSATGAIHMLNKQNISVPQEVSVIGYDNGIMATCAQPQLSSVIQDTQMLGHECIRTLNCLLNNETCSDVQIDVSLIVRQSSCRHVSPIP